MKCLLVSPTVATSKSQPGERFNGNAHTAQRWAEMLRAAGHRVTVVPADLTLDAAQLAAHDVMLALHARRSRRAIHQWHQAFKGEKPLVVALTGTDIYRDIHLDELAAKSLDEATHLITLQPEALSELTRAQRAKATVVVQSAVASPKARRQGNPFRVLMVGHLRDEKDPLTFMRAAELAADAGHLQVEWRHVGAGIDGELANTARSLDARVPSYVYLGALDHADVIQEMQKADLLIHASKLEGGAHVIAEAVVCGLPVLASHISGNIGMLGRAYKGYFALGDAVELASAVCRISGSPKELNALAQQCRERAPLFRPEREAGTLLTLFRSLSEPSSK